MSKSFLQNMNQDDMRQHSSRAEDCEAKDNCHILFHPDYTVGPGVTPDLLTPRISPRPLAGYTAGGELHPALRIKPGDITRRRFISDVWLGLQARRQQARGRFSS
jgi:hypothetical protein